MLYTHSFPHRALRLRCIACLFCLAFTPLPSKADVSKAPPLSIELMGDDGLTQKLSYYLEKMAKSKAISNDYENNSGNYIITSDKNVEYDVLNGRGIVIYRVKLVNSGRVLGDKTGICFENKMEKCAREIIRQFNNIVKVHELRTQR